MTFDENSNTYRAIKLISEQDLDFELVVMADDSLTWSNEETSWRRRLYLEHYRNISLINDLQRRFRSLLASWLEAYVRDWIKRHKLAPVFCLLLGRWRAKRCLMLRHLFLFAFLSD